MKRFKQVTLSILLVCFSVCTWGQTISGEIEEVWMEHDVYENGKKGMKIHVKFSVDGMLNKQGSCNIWFYYSNGTILKDANGQYNTSDGQVATHKNFTPSHASAIYNDFKIFMPHDELHLSNGSHNLKFFVGVNDNNKSRIATSEDQYFTFTKKGAEQTKQNNSTCSNCNGSGKKICSGCSGSGKLMCTCCNGTGIFTMYYSQVCTCCSGMGSVSCWGCYGLGGSICTSCNGGGGYIAPVPVSPIPASTPIYHNNSCSKCGGTATCQDCYGSGTKYNPTTGNTLQCTYCKGSGKCWLCNGTGHK